ncbi:hypothetical protein T4D_7571 [Trichinella pseudospiralis]|uniref:Uncharacterized protein n=1 Tax=Trichinella pseudospiralis TaxID=6337 RepID=A0A0V1FRQ8_TRIPS|nr:hypothetical protein T4D_7571 [Trichinella pseudospiralis]
MLYVKTEKQPMCCISQLTEVRRNSARQLNPSQSAIRIKPIIHQLADFHNLQPGMLATLIMRTRAQLMLTQRCGVNY